MFRGSAIDRLPRNLRPFLEVALQPSHLFEKQGLMSRCLDYSSGSRLNVLSSLRHVSSRFCVNLILRSGDSLNKQTADPLDRKITDWNVLMLSGGRRDDSVRSCSFVQTVCCNRIKSLLVQTVRCNVRSRSPVWQSGAIAVFAIAVT